MQPTAATGFGRNPKPVPPPPRARGGNPLPSLTAGHATDEGIRHDYLSMRQKRLSKNDKQEWNPSPSVRPTSSVTQSTSSSATPSMSSATSPTSQVISPTLSATPPMSSVTSSPSPVSHGARSSIYEGTMETPPRDGFSSATGQYITVLQPLGSPDPAFEKVSCILPQLLRVSQQTR